MASLSHFPSVADQWSCPQCTYDNEITAERRCEICGYEEKSQDDSSTEDATIFVWSCSRCTLDNKINLAYCDACGMPKDLLVSRSRSPRSKTKLNLVYLDYEINLLIESF